MRRAAIFGWGVVAPQSANIKEFATNLERADSWLAPFNGFGKDNFLVGQPKFDFKDYQPWVEARFPPSRFKQLGDKTPETRDKAFAALVQMGMVAVPLLRQAANNVDEADIAPRARDALKYIEGDEPTSEPAAPGTLTNPVH